MVLEILVASFNIPDTRPSPSLSTVLKIASNFILSALETTQVCVSLAAYNMINIIVIMMMMLMTLMMIITLYLLSQ
jgi:uncharacterized membrane protein